MKRNFEFDGWTVVHWRGRLIDLHNAYDLAGFGTDRQGSEARLDFVRNGYAIAPETLPSRVTLRCTGNVRIAVNDLGALAAPLGKEGVEIAYFDENCDWSSFIDEAMTRRQEPLGLHVSLADDVTVRIFCDEARLETGSD